ncbi:MAG: biotin--[Clostridia bacterium]|nr:biotin--[acetyl-CoA-carboxylase] ligase [Clostridia bacterium]
MDSREKNAQEIAAYLSEECRDTEIISLRETASTNDEAKKIALSGKKKTVLITADRQTAGRGRKGRSFFSPENTGIYMSLLFYPELSPELCTLITPLCAVALCEAIEKVTGIKSDIKWVNDIYLGGRKIAGILTEGSFSHKGADYVILGIGINLAEPEEGFPEEIRDIAASLGVNTPGIRSALIAETVNIFTERMKTIAERDFIDDYKSRLFFLGEKITVISPDGSYEATAENTDDMCRLQVRTENGKSITLN